MLKIITDIASLPIEERDAAIADISQKRGAYVANYVRARVNLAILDRIKMGRSLIVNLLNDKRRARAERHYELNVPKVGATRMQERMLQLSDEMSDAFDGIGIMSSDYSVTIGVRSSRQSGRKDGVSYSVGIGGVHFSACVIDGPERVLDTSFFVPFAPSFFGTHTDEARAAMIERAGDAARRLAAAATADLVAAA